jgi:hypothetical protein
MMRAQFRRSCSCASGAPAIQPDKELTNLF